MKNKGFTLIEVMVGVALLGFVTIAAYTFYLNTFQFQVIQERQKDMKMRLQLAMDLLVSDIRAAGFGVTDPSVGGDIRADGCVGVLPASCAPFVGVGGGNIAVTVQDNINVVNGITTDGIVMAERDQFIGALSIPTIAGNVITVGPPVVGTVVAGNLITIGGLFSSAVAGVVTNADNSTTITLGTAL
jgi:prepilin-type N-terminal cleavage/methylation domain-containing protein